MNGTIQIKKGRPNYYVVLDYIDEATGKRKRPWITTDIPVAGNNKRKANEKLKEVLAEYEQQQIDLSKNVLFVEFIKQWLENMKYSISPVTYDTYKMIIHNQVIPFYESKKLKVRDLTPLHIQQYVNFKLKTVSSNTVRKHLVNISKCLDGAVKQNIIAFNPVKRIELPKKVKYTGAQHYNEEEIRKLITAIRGDALEQIISFALFYGLRKSEILGLKWSAIDLINNTITIKHTVVKVNKIMHKMDSTKNKSSYRVMPLPQVIKDILNEVKTKQKSHQLLQPNNYVNEGYVFTNINGDVIKPDYVSHHFKDLLCKNNMPIIRFHDLRHSSASYLRYLGFDMKDIQAWLGHGDIGTTMNLYTNIDMDAKKNIANSLNEKFINLGM